MTVNDWHCLVFVQQNGWHSTHATEPRSLRIGGFTLSELRAAAEARPGSVFQLNQAGASRHLAAFKRNACPTDRWSKRCLAAQRLQGLEGPFHSADVHPGQVIIGGTSLLTPKRLIRTLRPEGVRTSEMIPSPNSNATPNIR